MEEKGNEKDKLKVVNEKKRSLARLENRQFM